MTRPIDLERRAALLHAVAGHLINKGHARDSLREIATGVGTSARMLMHHFGTRERLIGDALKLVRDRQLRAARQAISPGSDAIVTLRNLWRWYARKDTRRYFLLFEDVELRERISPSANSALTARLGTDWRPLFAEIFRQDARFAHDADLLAHLVVATLRGFARDRMSGASVSGQRHAFQTLIDMIGARATEEGRGGIHHDRACRRGDAGRCIR
jgi:AcrR family transcriptional regulator